MMKQKWNDLLFMHWPVDAAALRPLVPAPLEIETHSGSAWIGVVPFRMFGVRARFAPPLPCASAFPELNVRTYVRMADKPGVWFFSLDATSTLAVAAARHFFHLPYFRAQMLIAQTDGAGFDYRSSRTHRGASAADLRVVYKPTGEVFRAQPGTLEYFLAERYCLYAFDGQRVFRCEIDHAPWPLQPAEARIKLNTMAAASGILLPNQKPHLLFAAFQGVKVWPLAAAD